MAPPPPHDTHRTQQRREKPAAGLTKVAQPYGVSPAPRAQAYMALKRKETLPGLSQVPLWLQESGRLGPRGDPQGPLRDSGVGSLCPRVPETLVASAGTPQSCGHLDLKRPSGMACLTLFCHPDRGRDWPRVTQPGSNIADQRGILLPCHSHPAVFLSPQSTELPLWQLPPGAPVCPRSQTPSEVSWGPSGGISTPWLIRVLQQSEPHPLFPTFPFLEDPGDPQGERAQIE